MIWLLRPGKPVSTRIHAPPGRPTKKTFTKLIGIQPTSGAMRVIVVMVGREAVSGEALTLNRKVARSRPYPPGFVVPKGRRIRARSAAKRNSGLFGDRNEPLTRGGGSPASAGRQLTISVTPSRGFVLDDD